MNNYLNLPLFLLSLLIILSSSIICCSNFMEMLIGSSSGNNTDNSSGTAAGNGAVQTSAGSIPCTPSAGVLQLLFQSTNSCYYISTNDIKDAALGKIIYVYDANAKPVTFIDSVGNTHFVALRWMDATIGNNVVSGQLGWLYNSPTTSPQANLPADDNNFYGFCKIVNPNEGAITRLYVVNNILSLDTTGSSPFTDGQYNVTLGVNPSLPSNYTVML